MYLVNILDSLAGNDIFFYILIVLLAIICFAMFYLIYSQNKEMNNELKRQRLEKELDDALKEDNFVVNQEVKPEIIQPTSLSIPEKLEMTKSFYINDSNELRDITKELENIPRERKIEMTPYEAEQEEKAIISYEELLSKTNSMNIQMDDNLVDNVQTGKFENQSEEVVKNETKKNSAVKIPILSIRIMTDEEWNRLAYKNMLKRNGVA